jgi:hypothetical protein
MRKKMAMIGAGAIALLTFFGFILGTLLKLFAGENALTIAIVIVAISSILMMAGAVKGFQSFNVGSVTAASFTFALVGSVMTYPDASAFGTLSSMVTCGAIIVWFKYAHKTFPRKEE